MNINGSIILDGWRRKAGSLLGHLVVCGFKVMAARWRCWVKVATGWRGEATRRRERRLWWWRSGDAVQVGFRESSSKERKWQKGGAYGSFSGLEFLFVLIWVIFGLLILPPVWVLFWFWIVDRFWSLAWFDESMDCNGMCFGNGMYWWFGFMVWRQRITGIW